MFQIPYIHLHKLYHIFYKQQLQVHNYIYKMDLYNLQFADIAHELDKVNINELTPIEALNVLVKIKEKIAG